MSAFKIEKVVISIVSRIYRLSAETTGSQAVQPRILTTGNAKEKIRRSVLVQRRAAVSVSAVRYGHLRCVGMPPQIATA